MTILFGGLRRVPIGLVFLLVALLLIAAAVFVFDVLPLLQHAGHALLVDGPDAVSHRP